MISYIKGKVEVVYDNKIVVSTVSGIGYEMYFSEHINESDEVSLFVSHIIREADQSLFAFTKFKDKQLFELLLTVSGVGPKSSFSLVSAVGVEGIQDAIMLENVKLLRQAPGIGPKAAQQIILDLKNKISKFNFIQSTKSSLSSFDQSLNLVHQGKEIVNEALEAFTGLGFKEQHVLPIIKNTIQKNNNLKLEEIVKTVLQQINQ